MSTLQHDYVGKELAKDIAQLLGTAYGMGEQLTRSRGEANGIATLDANGKIPVSQLGNLDLSLFKIVTELPSILKDIDPKLIYLVKSTESTDQNTYKEYVYTGDTTSADATYDQTKWEQLGEYQATFDAVTDSVKVSDTIKVAGGPLASLLNEAGIDSIPVDMTMQELLKALCTKEIYPTPTYTAGTATVHMSESAIQLGVETGDYVTTNGGTVTSYEKFSDFNIICEKGVTVTFYGGLSDFISTGIDTTPSILSGLEYGYKLGDSTVTDTSITKTLTTTVSKHTSLKVGETSVVDVDDTKIGTPTYAANTVGTFNVTLSKTISGTATLPAFDSVYVLSNMGNTSNDHKSSAVASSSLTVSPYSLSGTAKLSVVYPVYATTSDITTLTKQKLNGDNEYILELVAEDDDNRQRFAIEANRTISSISMLNSLSGQYTDFPVKNFTTSTDSTLTSAGVATTYTVYTRNTPVSGACTLKIKFA